jgi:hypothetical protein
MLKMNPQVIQSGPRYKSTAFYTVFFLSEADANRATRLLFGSLHTRMHETDNWIVTFPWFLKESEKELYDEDKALRICRENHAFKFYRFR